MFKRLAIRTLQAPVQFYRYVLSPWIMPSCRFYPTCSRYMLDALDKHGPFKGLYLGIKRLLKCHPWCKCDYHDPVP